MNTLTLQNNNKWNELILYTPATGKIEFLNRYENIQIQGHYIISDQDVIMLYRSNGALRLKIGNNEYNLDDPSVEVRFSRQDRMNIFTLMKDKVQEYAIEYNSYQYDPINVLDFDFNDYTEEDQDFFLYIYNVLNNQNRRERIYTQ